MAKSMYKKIWRKRKSKNYCQLICFAIIPNCRGSLCDIKMLIYFSKKKVLPEFWRDWACEHLSTLHIWAGTPVWPYGSQKIPTNYCELTLRAIVKKWIDSLHNTLMITFFLTKFFLLSYCGRSEQSCLWNGHFCG